MPFPNVAKHGVERNFEQVLNSISHRLSLVLKVEDLAPDADNWTLSDDLSALESMVADSADRLWTAAIDENGNSRAALLEERIKTLELEQGRLTEQLSSLQVSGGR